MTKGKLYKELVEPGFPQGLIIKSGGMYEMDVENILDDAREEFPADNHGLDVEKVMPWFWKWFGLEDDGE
jgi:hypothetical protein